MPATFLTKKGTIENLTFAQLKTSWRKINEAYVNSATQQEVSFLRKYGLNPTIFNVSNLRFYGAVQLPPHFVKVALQHGAKDKRRR